MTEAEIEVISKKYEAFRLPDKTREKQLLQSILEHGVRQPLQCLPGDEQKYKYILLDGFKRLRCCHKLKLHMVPVVLLGNDEADCILQLLRASNERNLNTVEQARFVDELHRRYGFSVAELAERLECSAAWVSLRLGMIGEMSPVVRAAVFKARLPLRTYMYTLRQFTRLNNIPAQEIDRFVNAVSGKGFSTRDLDRLAQGYFRRGKRLKRQIAEGNLEWTLRQMKQQAPAQASEEGLSAAERSVIVNLELVQKYMSRSRYGLRGKGLDSQAFQAQALLLAEGLLSIIDKFKAQLRSFYEKRASQGSGQDTL